MPVYKREDMKDRKHFRDTVATRKPRNLLTKILERV